MKNTINMRTLWHVAIVLVLLNQILIGRDGLWGLRVGGGGINDMVISGDTMYVGGNFTHIEGVERRYLAAIDLTEKRLIEWSPVLEGMLDTSGVSSLQIYDDKIFALGKREWDGLLLTAIRHGSQEQAKVYRYVKALANIQIAGDFLYLVEKATNSSFSDYSLTLTNLRTDSVSVLRRLIDFEYPLCIKVFQDTVYVVGWQHIYTIPQSVDYDISWFIGHKRALHITEEHIYIGGFELQTTFCAMPTFARFKKNNPEMFEENIIGNVNAIVEHKGVVYLGGKYFDDYYDPRMPQAGIVPGDGMLYRVSDLSPFRGWEVPIKNYYKDGGVRSLIVANEKIYIGGYFYNVDNVHEAAGFAAVPLSYVPTHIETGDVAEHTSLRIVPNPLTAQGNIVMVTEKSGEYRCSISSLLGEEIATLHTGFLSAGQHSFPINGSLPSGVYLVRLIGNNISKAYLFNVQR